MAGDPNRDRDRALRDIAGYLKSIDRSLREIVRQNKVGNGLMPLSEYLEGERGSDSTDSANGSEHVGPYGTGPAPYGT
jgi:hypothetical protein